MPNRNAYLCVRLSPTALDGLAELAMSLARMAGGAEHFRAMERENVHMTFFFAGEQLGQLDQVGTRFVGGFEFFDAWIVDGQRGEVVAEGPHPASAPAAYADAQLTELAEPQQAALQGPDGTWLQDQAAGRLVWDGSLQSLTRARMI